MQRKVHLVSQNSRVLLQNQKILSFFFPFFPPPSFSFSSSSPRWRPAIYGVRGGAAPAARRPGQARPARGGPGRCRRSGGPAAGAVADDARRLGGRSRRRRRAAAQRPEQARPAQRRMPEQARTMRRRRSRAVGRGRGRRVHRGRRAFSALRHGAAVRRRQDTACELPGVGTARRLGRRPRRDSRGAAADSGAAMRRRRDGRRQVGGQAVQHAVLCTRAGRDCAAEELGRVAAPSAGGRRRGRVAFGARWRLEKPGLTHRRHRCPPPFFPPLFSCSSSFILSPDAGCHEYCRRGMAADGNAEGQPRQARCGMTDRVPT